jgi:hypothetical protein
MVICGEARGTLTVFDHLSFHKYTFEDVPLNRDIFLMSERWMDEYERAWIKTFEGGDGDPYRVGYISHAAASGSNLTLGTLA